MTNNSPSNNAKLIFHKLKFEQRFSVSFEGLSKNNEIDFNKNKNVAVIYAANGSGKSSLAELVDPTKSKSSEQEFDITFNSSKLTEKTKEECSPFYVISDFYARNIKDRSRESVQDFIIGKNILRELELEKSVAEKLRAINECLQNLRKQEFNITALRDRSHEEENDTIKEKILKNRYGLSVQDLFDISVVDVNRPEDSKKYEFIKKYYNDRNSILEKLLILDSKKINPIPEFRKIGIDKDAIKMLDRHEIKTCPFDSSPRPHDIEDTIRVRLNDNLQYNYNQLDSSVKKEVGSFFDYIGEDPFSIRETFKLAFETGDKTKIIELQNEVQQYAEHIPDDILCAVQHEIAASSIITDIEELRELKGRELELSGEDENLLKELASSLLSAEVAIKRDGGSRIVLEFSGENVIGKQHSQLPFSTGEKNFISLYFELMLAKNSDKEIIILDDPISSFDSIYKNKIIYAIIKLLNNKKVILLTHTLDTVRLTKHQRDTSRLYVMNNDNYDDGFVEIKDEEVNFAINMSKLLKTIKSQDFIKKYVRNKYFFAVSLVPFIRDYINIKADKSTASIKRYNKLSKLMHGYERANVNLTKIIRQVMGVVINSEDGTDIKLGSNDILKIRSLISGEIVDKKMYPLLNKTLIFNLNFLQLRILVEATLYAKDKNRLKLIRKHNPGLQAVVDAYLPYSDPSVLSWRTKLLSKKTLLNEFNHFEGNMSLFLPSLDISCSCLKNEEDEIRSICSEIGSADLNTFDKLN